MTHTRFSLIEVAAIALIILIWGYSNIAAQMATHALPPLLAGGLRFVIALLPLIAFLRPPYPSLKDLVIVAGLGGPVQFGLLYLAFSRVDYVGPLVVSLQLWIPLTSLMAWWLLGERVSRYAMAGMTLAFAGVVIMSLEGEARSDLDAIMIGLASSLSGAVGTAWVRKIPEVGAFRIQALICAASAPVLLLLACLFEGDVMAHVTHASLETWLLVLYSAFGSTLVATVLMFWLIRRHGAGRVTPWFLATPVVSVILSVLILGETLTVQVVTGGLAALAGIGVVAMAERRLSRA